jgi:hypothetical protein
VLRARNALLAAVFALTAAVVTAAPASALNVHTATFSGPYSTVKGHANTANSCKTAGSVVDNCQFTFPTPSAACIPDAPTTPSFGNGSLTIGNYTVNVPLHREGDGIFTGTGITLDGTNTSIWYMHINVEGLCDEDIDAAARNVLAGQQILPAPAWVYAGYANA